MLPTLLLALQAIVNPSHPPCMRWHGSAQQHFGLAKLGGRHPCQARLRFGLGRPPRHAERSKLRMTTAEAASELPITPLLPELVASLEEGPNLVLQAPPGAGKTTSVPLALLQKASWLREGSTILVLEPRRIAARSAALRMASALGEQVGMTVGYRVRQESKISPRTRIVCVTEGMLL